jgi:hypothetical protein
VLPEQNGGASDRQMPVNKITLIITIIVIDK